MNLALDLKLCAVKRKGESSDGETKKPGCSHLKKHKEGEETGAEERTRRTSFYSKGAIFTAEDQRSWLHRMEKKVRLPWSMGETMSYSEGHLMITDQNLQKAQEWWGPAQGSILLFDHFTSICVSCTGEREGWLHLAPFVKSGIFCTSPFLWRSTL